MLESPYVAAEGVLLSELHKGLLAAWTTACRRADPHGNGSSTALWKQLPQLADGMPALMEVLHQYLQLPREESTDFQEVILNRMVRQVQQLVELSAGSGAQLHVEGSKRQQGQAGGQEAGARRQQAVPGVPPAQEQTATYLSTTARTQVRPLRSCPFA
jgi:hypothetical protein